MKNSNISDDTISPRAQQILKRLVELYLQDGQPVGSKTLAQMATPNLSPATIRKVVGDLEDRGLLLSPHTSAGRMPTALGLRFFIDSLLQVHPLTGHAAKEVELHLEQGQPVDLLLNNTSQLLSEVTHLVGIVTVPKREHLILRYVEFLNLSDNRILVILVLNEQDVQNRIIVSEAVYSDSELKQVSNFLNQHFCGKELNQARRDLVASLERDRLQVDRFMRTVIDVAGKAFENTEPKSGYVLSGEANLVQSLSVERDKLHRLFNVFDEKRQILHLLDACLKTDGVQIFIGEESGYDALQACSVVTSRYTLNGEAVGVLGVIGPTRMPYDKVIPVVELTAKLLGEALK